MIALNSRQSELLCLLLATDLLLILLHLLHTFTGFFAHNNYSIEAERGFAEIYQYVKFFWVVLMSGWLWWRTSEKSYLSWSVVFGYFLLDDSFRLHESLGGKIALYFNYSEGLGLRAKDFGEMTIMAVFGVFILSVLGLGYYFGSPTFRSRFKILFVGILLLIGFGAAIDILHSALVEGSLLFTLVGIVEDGGELLVVSGMTWYVYSLLVGKTTLAPASA